jgi:hypothetical protein
MKNIPPDFDWPVWLARDDVPADRKAVWLARFVAAHGELPAGCEFVWSELTRLAGAGRTAEALLPRLCRLLPGDKLAALCRATPETQIRDFVAKLIFLGSTDPSLVPPLSAIVQVLDDQRLASVISHLGPLAGIYPAAEPQMGKRVLVWLQKLPADPAHLFQHLVAIRAGARWLTTGVDRVRAWRQFQELFERFAEVCRQMPILLPGAQKIAEREAAAQEMVAALLQAAPHDWYRDNKRADGKRRLLDGLIAQAGIPANKLPEDFEQKVLRYLTTRKWQAPVVVVPPQPEKDEPINPLTWIIPSVVGGLTLVGLFVALAGSWLWQAYQSWQIAPRPADAPPAHVIAGAPLPARGPRVEARGVASVATSESWSPSEPWAKSSPKLSRKPAPEPATLPPNRGPLDLPLDEDLDPAARFAPAGKMPPNVQGAVSIAGSLTVAFPPPFGVVPQLLPQAVPADLTAIPLGQSAALVLRNVPPDGCSIHLHGHQQLGGARASSDLFGHPRPPDLQSVEVRESTDGIEVQARFRGTSRPVKLVKFSLAGNVLRYQAGESSSGVDRESHAAGLRRLLRHCLLEIRLCGEGRSAFLTLAKPPAYRFALDTRGGRVIHAAAQNTLDLPGGVELGQLYLGQGKITYDRYRSISFGTDWLDEPARRAWSVRTPPGVSGWDSLEIELQSAGDRLALVVHPPAEMFTGQPAATQLDPLAAAARKRDLEGKFANAKNSIEPKWSARLNDFKYSDEKMRNFYSAAQTLAKELDLSPPPDLPRISASTKSRILREYSQLGRYYGGSPRSHETATEELIAKVEAYVHWGESVLIPEVERELRKLQRDIDGLPPEIPAALVRAHQQYQNWLRSSVAIEAHLYREVSCRTPGGEQTLRVVVVEPGSDAPPRVVARGDSPAEALWETHVAASGPDANIRLGETGLCSCVSPNRKFRLGETGLRGEFGPDAILCWGGNGFPAPDLLRWPQR